MGAEWIQTTIGGICDSSGGELQTGPFGSQLHAAEYLENGAVPVVTTSAVGKRHIDSSDVPRITREKANSLARHYLKTGDIVFARRGVQAAGLSALVERRHDGWLGGTGIIRLRLPAEKVDPTFLSFVLASNRTYEWIQQHSVGATMPNLNEGVVRGVPLLLPPLDEQRRIAAVLGALDDKIDLNRRMNRTLEAMAQAIFKSWFIDFDGHTDLAESGLGPIPRGWTICGFPNVVDILGGGTPRNEPDFWDGPIPWVSAKDAAQCSEVFVVQTEKTITKAGEASSSAKVRPAGTTIITARGTVGKTVLLPRPMAFNQSCYGLLPKDGHSTLFTFLLARSLVETLQRQAHGGIFDTITHRTFESLRIVAPPAEAISRFETVVGPLFQRVLLNTEQSLTLAALRDTLLPKLISGEIRVPEALEVIQEGS